MLAAALAVLALLLAAAAPAPASVTPPPQRGTYWGAWIGDQLTGGQPPWDMSAVSRFQSLTGKGPSLLEFSAPFANCGDDGCDPYYFPRYELETIRSYGAIPFFSWGSQASSGALTQPAYQLADIVDGTYDDYIREFASAAREWDHPFFLRFDWEMNGDWFPWSEGVNGNQPGEYVAAWRHVHDIFAQAGASKVTWVWCPFADSARRLPPMRRFYPGDSYVDWTCLDGFNWGSNSFNPQPWRSFDRLFGVSYRELVTKIAPRKPVVLAELGAAGPGRAKADWITEMFEALRTRYRQIRALIWFDQVDRGVQWPIESAPQSLAAFAGAISQRGFQPNRFQALSAGPIRPPADPRRGAIRTPRAANSSRQG
jgi:hypothetical protein